MRVSMDGSFFWVQLMLMLTYHEELIEALAMKVLRERNSELTREDPDESGDDVYKQVSSDVCEQEILHPAKGGRKTSVKHDKLLNQNVY